MSYFTRVLVFFLLLHVIGFLLIWGFLVACVILVFRGGAWQ